MSRGQETKSKASEDSRFALDESFFDTPEAGPSELHASEQESSNDDDEEGNSDYHDQGSDGDENEESDDDERAFEGLNPEGFAGPKEKVVKPLTPEALAAFRAAQERTGVLYISRIPPGMRPTKVRHLMSQYGEVGRVYLQQEDPKRAYLRKKFTSTKKPHFTEGWVEFKDKKVARSVATMLNAQPIGGKKGTRWRDDVWTMKYLPKFKWHMLTEQIAHEAAMHTARLRVELEQSRKEQKDYLRQVELARVLDKRKERKRKAAEEKGESVRDEDLLPVLKKVKASAGGPPQGNRKKRDTPTQDSAALTTVLGNIF